MQNQQTRPDPDSAFNSIVSGEAIPALPAGVTRLLEKLSRDDIDLTELTDAIAEYPSIVSRLLFLANSAWSAPVVPIDNIHLACSKLGLSVIRSVSIALSIATPFNPLLCKPFDTYKYWLHALMVGDIAKSLASELDAIPDSQTSALQTAGILHNIGLLWFADRLPAETTRALIEFKNNPEFRLDQHLAYQCQFGYCSVNGKLAQAWNFPPLLHTIIEFHATQEFEGKYHVQSNAVGLATSICKYVLNGETDKTNFEDARIKTLGIDEEALANVIEQSVARKSRFEAVIKVFSQSAV